MPIKKLSDLVDDYIRNERHLRLHEKAVFQRLEWGEVLRRAAHQIKADGNYDDHQFRRMPDTRNEAHQTFIKHSAHLSEVCRFDDLYNFVEGILNPVKWTGPLFCYDAALRIGYSLGVEPTQVYVQRGVRDGVTALGLPLSRTMTLHQFPFPTLERLTAEELENFLCNRASEIQIAANNGLLI